VIMKNIDQTPWSNMEYQLWHAPIDFEDLDEPYPNSGFKLYNWPAIQILGLNGELDGEDPKVPEVETPLAKEGFWKRQFGTKVTRAQRKWDWILGVIMPVLCITFDPIVFNGINGGDGMLTFIKPFAYLLSYVSIMAMIAWLLWGDKLKGLNGVLAGLFLTGGAVSLAIGIVLFPFSLIGSIVVIGALGFTPLLTSVVFLRNSARAYRSAKEFLEPTLLKHLFAVSALFSAIVPYVFQAEIRKGLANHLSYLLR
jgi:hypothetical protein